MDSVAITGQLYLYKVHIFFLQFTHIVTRPPAVYTDVRRLLYEYH